MNNKVDLESAIYVAWQTSEDLELFFKHYGDHPKPMTEDEVVLRTELVDDINKVKIKPFRQGKFFW